MIHVWSAVQRRHASRRITEVSLYGIRKILVKLRACANSGYQAFLPERRGCEATAATDLGAAGEGVFIAVEKLSSQEGAALVEQSESPRRSNTVNLAASFGLHVSSSSPCSAGVEADCGVPMFSHNEVQDYEPQADTPTGGRSPSVGHSENASLWRPGDAQSTLDGDSTSVDVVCVDSVSERSSCVGTGSCSGGGGGGGGREGGGYMACRFMCCLCLCKQSAGKGRTCSRLTLEMQLYTVIHVIIVQIKV